MPFGHGSYALANRIEHDVVPLVLIFLRIQEPSRKAERLYLVSDHCGRLDVVFENKVLFGGLLRLFITFFAVLFCATV